MTIYEHLTSKPQNLEKKKYNIYIIDGEEFEVEPHDEEEFLKANPTATLLVPEEKEKQVNLKTNEVSEPIKNQETSQFQINQQEDINENTENVDFINKYNGFISSN